MGLNLRCHSEGGFFWLDMKLTECFLSETFNDSPNAEIIPAKG